MTITPRGRLGSLTSRKTLATTILMRLQKQNPSPRCELYYRTPYQLLVSVVLSAQTTDRSVNQCMKPLYNREFSPQTAVKLGIKGIERKIRTIGLAPTKAKNVFNLSKILLNDYNGAVPKTRKELESLPGVGRKTANVILAELYQEPTLAVDTHVFRVTYRLGLHRIDNREKAEQELMKVIDRQFLPAAHHWFILHGRYTCKAINPNCNECILNDLCPSFRNI